MKDIKKIKDLKNFKELEKDIVNLSSFKWGAFVTFIVVFSFTFEPITYLRWYEKLLLLLPGASLMAYGVAPNSTLGSFGKMIRDYFNKDKKKK
tara:strand:+ start:1535 stop:1813 length:279 start_codon:yes stop_codon:yes gene_type:complete